MDEASLEKRELNKRNSVVVASHQWIVGELSQIIVLVAGFRRKLSECAEPSPSGACDADTAASASQRDRDVDDGLQQIERLLSALVRIRPDDISDVDIYGCDYTEHDRLTSTAGRLLRDNRSLDLQLSQAIRENMDLQLSVERLESDAHRLRKHGVTLQDELDRLHAASNHFRAELGELLPDAESADAKSVVEVFGELKNRIQQLQTMNNALEAKVAQLEDDASLSQSTELHTICADLEPELEAKREAQLKLENGTRRASEPSDQLPETTLPATEDLVTRIGELETQLCVHQDRCAAMKLSLKQEREFSRQIGKEKKQLIYKIEELQLDAKKAKDDFDITRKQLDSDNERIRNQNDELMAKISELEMAMTADAYDYSTRQENTRLKDEIAVYRRSKLILKTDDKIRQHHQSTDSESGSAGELEVGQPADNVAGKVTDVHARLFDANAALEKAVEARDVLTRDLDQARIDNGKLSGVVVELRAELNSRDSDIIRLRVTISDLEDRLASERREFCDAVELVRRENAAECEKIAEENRHLTTLLTELEKSYAEKISSPNDKVRSSNDGRLLLAEDNSLQENSSRRTESWTQCEDELLASMSTMIDSLRLEVSLLESRNEELSSALEAAERQQIQNSIEYHSATSLCSVGCQTDQTTFDAQRPDYSNTHTNDSKLETKISAETNSINASAKHEDLAVGRPKSRQMVDGFAKVIDVANECRQELVTGESQEERSTSERHRQTMHVDETAAKLASNARMMEKLRRENNELRQKLRQQLCVEACLMEDSSRTDNDGEFEELGGSKSYSHDDNCRSYSLPVVERGDDLQVAAASMGEGASELPGNENRTLRQGIAAARNASVQHDVGRNDATQTKEASNSRQFEHEIYSLSIDNQMLSAELLDAQVRAVDAMRRSPPAAGRTLDIWQSRLRRLVTSEIQRKRSSTETLEQRLQHLQDNSSNCENELMTDADESRERLGELKRSLQSDNDALRHVLSTLNELEHSSSNVLQQHGDVSHHGDDINSLSSIYLHQEISGLQQLLLVKL